MPVVRTTSPEGLAHKAWPLCKSMQAELASRDAEIGQLNLELRAANKLLDENPGGVADGLKKQLHAGQLAVDDVRASCLLLLLLLCCAVVLLMHPIDCAAGCGQGRVHALSSAHRLG